MLKKKKLPPSKKIPGKKVSPGKNKSKKSGMPSEDVLSKIKFGTKTIYLLGTAHVSQQSVLDVEKCVHQLKPSVICVELDEARAKNLQDPEAWKKLDMVQVIKNRKLYLLMSSVMLSVFQKKIGAKTETPPGSEMKRAIELAEDKNCKLELIDRDVQLTLKRAWTSVGFFSKMTILSELLASAFTGSEVDAGEIENLKKRDAIGALLENLPPRYRRIQHIIIDERDMYMAQKLRTLSELDKKKENILVVVGAGHVPGILKQIHEEHFLHRLEHVRKRPLWLAILKFFLPILIIMGLIWYFTDKSITKDISTSIITWVTVKAACAGLFSLLWLPHPLALLSAMIVSPIGNFNPVLKPGWVAALIEAKFRKPLVNDFENIANDTDSFKGFYKNRVLRVFLIFFLAQLGGSIGTLVSVWLIGKN